MHKYGIRSLLALIIIIGYFTLLRPGRALVNKSVLTPALEKVTNSHPGLTLTEESSSVSNRILIEGGGQFYFKVPFGLNFLLAMVGLSLLSARTIFYGYLAGIQIIGVIIAFVSFYLGGILSLKLVILSDLMVRYLIPLCSLGIVPVAYIFKTENINEREASETADHSA